MGVAQPPPSALSPPPIDAATDSDDEEMQIFARGSEKLRLQVLTSGTISTIAAVVQNKE